MRMRHHRGTSELNLTPLLDVLFCILFIVMLTSAQDVKNAEAASTDAAAAMQSQYDAVTEDNANLVSENADLTKENEALRNELQVYRDSEQAIDLYSREAVIISISNTIADGTHQLVLERDDSKTVISMGAGRVEYAGRQLEEYFASILEEIDNQPVYVVFACNHSTIFTSEFNEITEILETLQSNNKEVFYKLTTSESEE